ncbi:DUF6340 family protein [Prolixibacter sp. NT017]|uniref:DUF6340 family protein n=1 Tax=Prolixibacter sp. NT017 TaxID=2652390 RepID=UPI00129914BE|nr:DUF6340 family protein [Prolixibacter sp. NT017]
MNRVRIVFYFLFMLAGVSLLGGCSAVRTINIQLLQPPPTFVSDSVQSLTVFNRSMTPDFKNWDRDSLEQLLANRHLELDTTLRDSIAADTVIQVAAHQLFNSGRFDVVIPKESNLTNYLPATISPEPLDWNFVATMCQNFNTDALLVLESFNEEVNTDFDSGYEQDFSGNMVETYYGALDLTYHSRWRLYDPKHRERIRTFDVTDTIFWDSYGYTAEEMYYKLPSIKEALIEGGVVTGQDLAKKIAPQWKDARRRLFTTGKKDIDKAIPLAEKGDWEAAQKIWEQYADEGAKGRRSKVEFNLALANEMNGHIEKAIEWGVKSYKTYYRHQTDEYLRILDKRRKLLNKIDEEKETD